MRILLLLASLFAVFSSYAQEITVMDEATKQPIFNVAVFNQDKSKSTLTDFDGKAVDTIRRAIEYQIPEKLDLI